MTHHTMSKHSTTELHLTPKGYSLTLLIHFTICSKSVCLFLPVDYEHVQSLGVCFYLLAMNMFKV